MTGTAVTACEVCGNPALEAVLDLGRHPLCDDLIPIGDPRRCREYPIEILYCPRCATAHQRFQVPKAALFPASYHYRSRFTADVLAGMAELVEACGRRLGDLSGKTVLDIGCNDGSLLDMFQAKGARTLGIEPTHACRDAEGRGHVLFQRFFDAEVAGEIRDRFGAPDLVTFANVFAHIEDLGAVLASLRKIMGPTTELVIENHYLGAVLDRYQFDTFYHEHPRTYSLTSFAHVAQSLGRELKGVEFPARYGGNIRVFIGGGPSFRADEIRSRESGFGKRFDELRDGTARWRSQASDRIEALTRRHGTLAGKAFPGRAAILVRLLGIDSDRLDCVYEKPGSMKIGHYVPGTRIPIRSDDELFDGGEAPPVLLNLAWHIRDEIEAYLRAAGFRGGISHIVEASDFVAQEGACSR